MLGKTTLSMSDAKLGKCDNCNGIWNMNIYKCCQKCTGSLRPLGELAQPKSSITAEAEEIINGDRRQSYGEVKDSFVRFSLAWTGYLKNKLKPGEEITPNDVAMLNVIGKALREGNKIKRDNRVDIIGYTLLADKLTNYDETTK